MGEGWREGIVKGVWDAYVHTAVFNMDKQQGPTVQYMEICSMLCDNLDWRGICGDNGYMYIHMGEFFHCSPETITTCLLIGYTPVQNRSLKKESHNGHSKKKKKNPP